MRYRLKRLDQVDPRNPLIDLPDERPFATGNGVHDILCGHCDNPLFAKLDVPPRPSAVTLVCGKCRSANALNPTLIPESEQQVLSKELLPLPS